MTVSDLNLQFNYIEIHLVKISQYQRFPSGYRLSTIQKGSLLYDKSCLLREFIRLFYPKLYNHISQYSDVTVP